MNASNQPTAQTPNVAQFLAPTAHQTASLQTRYCAVPYAYDGRTFYFSDLDGYNKRYAARLPVEEYEIQLVDGSDAEAQLFNLLGVNQATLERWFDEVVDLTEDQHAALAFLVGDLGLSLSDALDKMDDVNLREGSLLEAATEFFDECYLNDIPEAVRFYIDYDAFARDQNLSGAMSELEFAGQTYTVTNADAR
ncbi:antirestriction protein ArdA [Burkholderia sp. SRS-W-2-2016]|uniref:antirestriction protein ArdA n=1 Tax=Burkholderia sp. SRS-W-2-2016 TaxID=1926878 RepID=UPI0009F97F65|nr:antirestriction protein ArdA [Burkholderia sp. SRS-W-2-2016]